MPSGTLVDGAIGRFVWLEPRFPVPWDEQAPPLYGGQDFARLRATPDVEPSFEAEARSREGIAIVAGDDVELAGEFAGGGDQTKTVNNTEDLTVSPLRGIRIPEGVHHGPDVIGAPMDAFLYQAADEVRSGGPVGSLGCRPDMVGELLRVVACAAVVKRTKAPARIAVDIDKPNLLTLARALVVSFDLIAQRHP